MKDKQNKGCLLGHPEVKTMKKGIKTHITDNTSISESHQNEQKHANVYVGVIQRNKQNG